MTYEETIQRQNKIKELRNSGKTLREISEILNLSFQRVHSISNKEYREDKFTNEANPIWENQPKWRKKGRDRIRFLVRHRDNFTCQSCERKWEKGERHFDVHHLNGLCGKKSRGYDKSEDIDTLITLCHKCHFNHPEHSRSL